MTEPVKPAGLRAARVLENEEPILRSARELFVRDGYQATTLTAVADAAGVAHRTVYVRFGTKAALLKRVIDVAIVGDLAPIDMVSREWYRIATTAPTLEARIAALAKGSARLMASVADVIAVAREAEPAEPLLAAAAHAGRAATRDAIGTFWTRARDDGLLPAGCDLTWLADTTSVTARCANQSATAASVDIATSSPVVLFTGSRRRSTTRHSAGPRSTGRSSSVHASRGHPGTGHGHRDASGGLICRSIRRVHSTRCPLQSTLPQLQSTLPQPTFARIAQPPFPARRGRQVPGAGSGQCGPGS